MSLGDGRDGDKLPYPAHLEEGVPGEVLRIKKEPYTEPTTKQNYPTRGEGRDIGRGLGDGEAMGIGLSNEGRV